MKKIFTLIFALCGLASYASAATVDDLQQAKHSFVFVADSYTNNGAGPRTGGALTADGKILDVTGGSVATNKGKIDLSQVSTDALSGDMVTEDIVAKYASYGAHLNSLRLKNDQDVIAMKVTQGSKLIIFYNANNKGAEPTRYPYIGLTSTPTKESNNPIKQGKVVGYNQGSARYEWTADNDYTIYIGGKGGDQFISYIIYEANEPAGTPSVSVGAQSFENGLYYKDVTVTPQQADGANTIVYYTTDGTDPTTSSTKYTTPIRCYAPTTLKFQAYMDDGTGNPSEDFIANGASNEAVVNFDFNAPTITAEGGNVTIASEYENAQNYYSVNGTDTVAGSTVTLTESGTVTAYSVITNGTYATFTSASTSKDVYVLNAIKSEKTFTVSGTAVEDPEATAEKGDGTIVYKVEDGKVNADKMDAFVKNAKFAAVTDEGYQAPAGQQVYLQMSDTKLTFKVAAGDSVDVTVTTSKNSCKNITDVTTMDKDSVTYTNLKNFVNVNGTNYGFNNTPDNFQNVITFGLKAGDTDTYFTFQKWSGTGNILISSINIKPAGVETPQQNGIVYDFASAVKDSANALDWNLNPTKTYDPFVRENNGSDRTERNWRGYQNYAGTILPAVCHIYFVRPIAQDADGLVFANKTWMALDSLKTNDVITIEYSTENGDSIVYGSGPSVPTQAAIENAVCVPNVTTIGSGVKVAVFNAVDAEKAPAYVCFRLPAKTHLYKVSVVNDADATAAIMSTTGINEINNVKTINVNAPMYNLAGQRVSKSFRGVVIQNGRKFLQ